jgi:hypothetical protein
VLAVGGLQGVGIEEADGAGVRVQLHARGLDLGQQGGALADAGDHLVHAREQASVVEPRGADLDPILSQLAGFAHQPGGMGERAHRNRPVVRRHAAERALGDKGRARAEVAGAQGRQGSGRPGPDHQHVADAHDGGSGRSASQRRACRPGMKP